MKFTTTDQAIHSLMQRLACENLQMLALIKLGYNARQIDAIIQPGDKRTRVIRDNIPVGEGFKPSPTSGARESEEQPTRWSRRGGVRHACTGRPA